MDEIKARDIEAKIKGEIVGSWRIIEYIDHGKSAAVFKAEGPTGLAAIKIFDDELIKKYGDAVQLARIDREIMLAGKAHPNLVGILGGGLDRLTGNHFIAMDYLAGPSLRKCLRDIPPENVEALVAQLAAAAHFLEDEGYVHRDIKPDNIVILNDFSKLVLLDLGVIRPISGSDLTDQHGIQEFVGTLRYSSPEFLLRTEEDSRDGWRSLTFYQIGGVIHDLVMGIPLFEDYAMPYGRLVNAVQNVVPEIQNSSFPSYLLEVARFCLLKNWKTRLGLVRWESFSPPVKSAESRESARQRVANRAVAAEAQMQEITAVTPEDQSLADASLLRDLVRHIGESARTVRSENGRLPPLRTVSVSPDLGEICIEFDSSQTFCLREKLTIQHRAKIVESSARIVSVEALGCIGEYFPDRAPKPAVAIFTGTFDGAAVYEALETCLYDFLDQAQIATATQRISNEALWFYPTVEV